MLLILLEMKYGSQYTNDYRILNSMNYGIPQSRKRSFIKVYKKGLSWKWPKESEDVNRMRRYWASSIYRVWRTVKI